MLLQTLLDLLRHAAVPREAAVLQGESEPSPFRHAALHPPPAPPHGAAGEGGGGGEGGGEGGGGDGGGGGMAGEARGTASTPEVEVEAELAVVDARSAVVSHRTLPSSRPFSLSALLLSRTTLLSRLFSPGGRRISASLC